MPGIKYLFREDAVRAFRGADTADAQVIGEQLERIAEENGGELAPPAVVEKARSPRHALHKFFTWDDAEAAHQHRLTEARSIIRSICIADDRTESGVTRAFLSVQSTDGRSYRTAADVLNSADLQRRVLDQAERDLLAFEQRYRNLVDVCETIKRAREQVQSRRNRPSKDSRPRADA